MIPNMSDVVSDFTQSFIYVREVVISEGFEDTTDSIETNLIGVIQIPNDETINANKLDYSLNYRQVHIKSTLGITPKTNDFIKYKNKNYKVVRVRDYAEYGYYEFIVEEVANGGY